MHRSRTGWSSLGLLGLVGLALAACSDGAAGDSPGPAADDASTPKPIVRRVIAPDVLARKAIAYSGYRREQSPDVQAYPSKAEIEQDLRLLVRGGWGFIRLFDSGPHAERVLEVIDETGLDLRVLLGVWIAGPDPEHAAANRGQIDRGVALALAHPTVVVAVSVGNETLDDWSNVRIAPAQLVAHIAEVRGRIPQPVTTDDSWLPFMLESDGNTSYAEVIEVARAVDFLCLHVYAFADAYYDSWAWQLEQVPAAERARAMMDAAMDYTRLGIRSVRARMASRGVDAPILIGEAGWKDATPFSPNNPKDAAEDAIEAYFAHPMNQKMFYDDLMAWVYGEGVDADSPAGAFYFEAFDEPWKGEWGDDGWGLFDVDRRPKYVVWELFPELVPDGANGYTDADAVHF